MQFLNRSTAKWMCKGKKVKAQICIVLNYETHLRMACTKVRTHHDGASWTSLASCPSQNQVQAGDDSFQVSKRIGANILGGRLSDNLCNWR